MKRHSIQHLYLRAGFGISKSKLDNLASHSKAEVVEQLFANSRKLEPLKIDLSEFEEFLNSPKSEHPKPTPAEKQAFRKKSRQKIKELNNAWIDRLIDTDSVLGEKMTLFWSNVFVCKDKTVWHFQQYNNTLREHALGNLRTFVKAISKEPSMIKYLNNKQNVKDSPNENFARELMELFTLGEGNYTEEDIHNSARAFTGYSFRKDGSFRLIKKKHDEGIKTFMGKSGNFDGDDIIDIILEQKACARFICKKVYRYFVNDKIDEKHIDELTEFFYRHYDIKKLMHHIFISDWFYSPENIGVKIKSPIELLVGIQRSVDVKFEKPKQRIFIQKMMGQTLLDPPNVAGWKGGKNWIDSNTMMFRLKLASILLYHNEIELIAKGEFDDSFDDYYMENKKGKQKIKTLVNWNQFDNEFASLDLEGMQDQLINCEISPETKSFLSKLSVSNHRAYCVQLMSIPEYQLC
ncbi:MAG: DUF1800 domain-containing protein [Bacteroidetes bacterium]|nr:MAG: DUF1800 domain-containing protein [Bacteroidota bacterium]